MCRFGTAACWDALVEKSFARHVVHLETTDSTNDEARRRLAAGTVPPFLVSADRQTRGRGRRENRWWTGEGSLAMTLCVREDSLGVLPWKVSLLSLTTALSVAEAASGTLLHREATVHWPNDVYVGERKLGGILIERTAEAYLIGIGVNTNNQAAAAPRELVPRVTTLRDLLGKPVDSVAVAGEILRRFEDNLRHHVDSAGLLLAEVNRRCGQRGRSLTIRRGDETIVGTFVEISLDGELVVGTPQGRRAVGFGTVISFR
jgi:BirA family transcriptional regulator, biotin operon repressor / biotin---[acetyl-CoA-carboxylase] ligase